MKINGLEEFLAKIRAGRTALGAVVTFADSAVTELTCEAGFDFVWIDGEHGEMDRVVAMQHLMAARGTGVATLYRVPACNHAEIKKVIDFAPAGIIVPMVMDEKDAALAVSACRYPCHGGDRGCGFRRGWAYGVAETGEYLAASARDPLVLLQLEHIDAARRLDAILEVSGIDGILIGPYDFSMSMGVPGDFHDPAFAAEMDAACGKIRAKGLLLGCYCEADFDVWRRRGVQFMAVKNDTNAMLLGYRAMLERARA